MIDRFDILFTIGLCLLAVGLYLYSVALSLTVMGVIIAAFALWGGIGISKHGNDISDSE